MTVTSTEVIALFVTAWTIRNMSYYRETNFIEQRGQVISNRKLSKLCSMNVKAAKCPKGSSRHFLMTTLGSTQIVFSLHCVSSIILSFDVNIPLNSLNFFWSFWSSLPVWKRKRRFLLYLGIYFLKKRVILYFYFY